MEIILVDVRRKDRFDAFRIPGSINLPLFAVKTKTFLKTTPLVLLNEGFNLSELKRACQELRDAGFRAWFLNGGLNAWKEGGASLEGDPFAQRGLNQILPSEFFRAKSGDRWIVIDVSAPPISAVRSPVPQSISMPFGDERRFMEAFGRAVERQNEARFLPILIFNEEGDQYDRIEEVIQKTGARHVFYLKGGLKVYKSFLEQQAIIRQTRNRPEKTLNQFGKCP